MAARRESIFTATTVHDMSDFGLGVLHGAAATAMPKNCGTRMKQRVETLAMSGKRRDAGQHPARALEGIGVGPSGRIGNVVC